MQIETIKMDQIDADDRVRPVNEDSVFRLLADIEDRGLRTPIEVAKRPATEGYRLVSGAPRLEACKRLGYDEIPCFLVKGNLTQLRRDELFENLAPRQTNSPSAIFSFSASSFGG